MARACTVGREFESHEEGRFYTEYPYLSSINTRNEKEGEDSHESTSIPPQTNKGTLEKEEHSITMLRNSHSVIAGKI